MPSADASPCVSYGNFEMRWVYFDKLQPGEAVQMRYLPDKPQICRFEL